ncbi:MAG TPA: hypothetical protein VG347_09735 [Verrucomicrobiae bacterium]|nr:hypothetical protein [Verrucomicrobiae bacterium]
MKNRTPTRLAAARKFKARIWPTMLRLGWPLVWLRRRLRPHKISLSRIEGVVARGEQPLTMVLGVMNQNRDYLLQLAFQKITREEGPSQVRLLDAFRPEYSRGKNAGMVILETNQPLHGWLDDGCWFFIPSWVSGQLSLPLPEKVLRNDTLRTIRRKIVKHGYEYEVASTEERFNDFYENLHVPYVTKVYGSTANCQPRGEVWEKSISEGFDLIWIRKKSEPDKYLAACLMVYEAAAPRIWSFGVRDGNEELVQEGVLSALYLFCFEHLLKNGFTQINMGGSRPFLRDGVLIFKKRLSQTVAHARWEGFSLKILELTPAVKVFLVNNPFIFFANGRMHGAVFTEAPLTVEAVEELHRTNFYRGLSKLVLYFFNRDERFQAASLPPELAARVEIRSAAEVVSGRLHLP